MFSAVQAVDKDCHGFVSRASLHLIIGALTLVAATAQELIGGHGLIPLELPLLTNLLLLEALLPTRFKEIIGTHATEIVEADFSLLIALKELLIPDIGLGMEVAGDMARAHLIEMQEGQMGPGTSHVATLCLPNAAIVDTAL